MNMAGAVDLGALAAARKAQADAAVKTVREAKSMAAGVRPSTVFDSTDATFQADVLERSMRNPVVVDLWAEWCQPCKTLSPILERVIDSYDGAMFLAKVDVDANPQLSQAFQVQSIPAVFVVVAGQVMPLFQGAIAEPQAQQVMEQVLTLAKEQGLPCLPFAEVAGMSDDAGDAPGGEARGDDWTAASERDDYAADATDTVADVDATVSEAFDRAADAIDAGDWDGAVAAYNEVLAGDPEDADAKAGLLLVGLMRRGGTADPDELVRAAIAAPADVQAQILAADALVLSARYDEAFAVLIAAVKSFAGKERDEARARLLELFDVVGAGNPSVSTARIALANALF